jgi:hypothetical protein
MIPFLLFAATPLIGFARRFLSARFEHFAIDDFAMLELEHCPASSTKFPLGDAQSWLSSMVI